MSLLQLVGSKVVKAEIIEEDLQICFQNGECLAVYNLYKITASDGSVGNDLHLQGATLSEINEDKTSLRLTFSSGVELCLDMSEDGYRGPEALQLVRPGLPSVVWRIDD